MLSFLLVNLWLHLWLFPPPSAQGEFLEVELHNLKKYAFFYDSLHIAKKGGHFSLL